MLPGAPAADIVVGAGLLDALRGGFEDLAYAGTRIAGMAFKELDEDVVSRGSVLNENRAAIGQVSDASAMIGEGLDIGVNG